MICGGQKEIVHLYSDNKIHLKVFWSKQRGMAETFFNRMSLCCLIWVANHLPKMLSTTCCSLCGVPSSNKSKPNWPKNQLEHFLEDHSNEHFCVRICCALCLVYCKEIPALVQNGQSKVMNSSKKSFLKNFTF